MAKRSRKRKKNEITPRQRDISIISQRKELLSGLLRDDLKRDVSRETKRRRIYDDRRYYKPELHYEYRKLDGTVAYVVTQSIPERKAIFKARLKFADPRRTIVCLRRKRRRELLFSLGKAGKGKRVSDIRKYRDESNIKC